MKYLNINNVFIKVLCGLALIGSFVGSAQAIQINGSLGYGGNWTPVNISGDATTLALATGIIWSGDVVVQNVNGDLTSTITVGDAVGTTDFQFNTLPVLGLWSVGTFSFELTSVSAPDTTSLFGSLLLSGEGNVTGPGDFTSTVGRWIFTGNDSGFGTFNFSAGTTVPEPASIALLGLGLLGFAVARKARKAA